MRKKLSKKNKRKGQASIEYLSTYLWAGLALISVLGALTYLGAFDTSRYVKEECNSGSQIQCLEAFTDTDTIQLLIKNNHPFPIRLNNINITEPFNYYKELNLMLKKNSEATIIIDQPIEGTGTTKVIFKAEYQRLNSELETNPQTPVHEITGEMIIKPKEKTNDNPYQTQTGYCGDGIIETNRGEECDPPITLTTEGMTQGQQNNGCGTNNYCDSECKCQPITSQCGNGIIELGETCEEGEILNDCTTQGPDLIGTVTCNNCQINYHCGPRPMISVERLPDAIAGQSYDYTLPLQGCDEGCQVIIIKSEENIEGTQVWAPRVDPADNTRPMLPLGLSFDSDNKRLYRHERAGPIPTSRYNPGVRPSNYRITFNITNPYGENIQTLYFILRSY